MLEFQSRTVYVTNHRPPLSLPSAACCADLVAAKEVTIAQAASTAASVSTLIVPNMITQSTAYLQVGNNTFH